MEKITLTKTNGEFSPPEMLKKVHEYGLCVLPEFSGADELVPLNEEFDAILSGQPREGINPIELNAGAGADVHLYELGGQFPRMQEFFRASWMQEISDEYWEGPAKLNDHIYVMKEVAGTEHVAQDLHFDVLKTFKFFLYLNDVTAENGAFSCVPGSQKLTEQKREELGDSVSYENRELTREHPYSEDEIIPIEGKAGTLIIFTTEVWHRAGKVSQGERRVMRGHTRLAPKPKKAKAPREKRPQKKQKKGLGGVLDRIRGKA